LHRQLGKEPGGKIRGSCTRFFDSLDRPSFIEREWGRVPGGDDPSRHFTILARSFLLNRFVRLRAGNHEGQQETGSRLGSVMLLSKNICRQKFEGLAKDNGVTLNRISSRWRALPAGKRCGDTIAFS